VADWYVGQRVVCVAADWKVGPFSEKPAMPIVACVYTIRDIEPVFFDDAVAFRFEEIVNKPISFGNHREPTFHQKFFRPVVEPDISELQAILDHLPKREVVDA
jgi:hypothetical protein